jgi:hypothetical protein
MLLICAGIAVGNSALAGNGRTPIIIQESFADGSGFKRFNIDSRMWQTINGALQNTPGQSAHFEFGDTGWNDYEITFRLRRLKAYQQDQHFGVFVRTSPTGGVRLYSRGDSIIYMVDSRHEVLGNLTQPWPAEPNAPYRAFRIVVNGPQITVYADNALVGTIGKVALAAGKIGMYAMGVDIAMKDLKVFVSRTGEENTTSNATSKNILHNSGFEQCMLDDLPDYWGCPHWGLADSYWATHFGEWQRTFITDKTVAYQGTRSMRLSNPPHKPSGTALWSVCVGAKMNEPYTLSAYMKSKPAGLKVKLGSAGGKADLFTLTDEWRRYSTAFIKDKDSLYADMIQIAPQDKGVVWIDAVQLENGPLTAYQPMKNETQQLQAEEGNVNKVLTQVPKYEPPYHDRQLTLTGKLDDKIWEQVPTMKAVTTSGDTVKEPTETHVWYNNKGIYLGVKCFDRNAGNNKCSVTTRDGNVWNDPSLELFIDPQLSRNYYYHLAVNQIGVQYDGFCGDASWNGKWKAVTYTDPAGKYWSAEIFLPFGELGIDPTASNWWGFNICRTNHAMQEYSCWSPTYGSFHVPTRFGQISIDRTTQENYYAGCSGAQLHNESANSSSLAVTLYNGSKRDQRYHLSAKLVDPRDKEIARFSQPVTLRQGDEQTIELGNVNCRAGTKYRLALDLRADDSGDLYFSGVRDLEPPTSLTVRTQYDLYTREGTLRARVQLNVGRALLAGARLNLKIHDSAGNEVASTTVDAPQQETEAEIGIGSLKNGDYVLKAELKTGGGVFAASKDFRKLPPVANEVKTDHFARMAAVNGKPFFPIGLMLEGNQTPECIKYYAESGVNSVSVIARLSDYPGMTKLLDCAAENNVKVLLQFAAPQDEEAKKNTAKFMRTFKDHPAVLAWFLFDEIFTIEWGKNNYRAVATGCTEFKQLEPYHPVHINENSYGLSFLKNAKLEFPGDVVSLDHYPYPPDSSLQLVSTHAKTMWETGQRDGKPCWMYLFGAGYTFWASRDLTPAEQDFETYTAIINGIRGIHYFADHPKSKTHWARMKGLFREVKELAPILAATAKAPVIKCNTPAIECLVKQSETGVYLITVNNTKDPVNARFDLSKVRDGGNRAEALFENRKVRIEHRSLADTFDGFQRHVYWLKQ